MNKIIALLLSIIISAFAFIGCELIDFTKGDNTPEIKYSEGLEFDLNMDKKSYSLTGIGSCTDTEIIIPSTYNDLHVTAIDDIALHNCTSLTSIVIPDSVEKIGYGAFQNCTSLSSIVLSNSLTDIYTHAFENCTSLESITIPKSVTKIFERAFKNCTSLKKVIFEDPSNWGKGELVYNPIYDLYEWKAFPIPEDPSDPVLAAELLTSTYVEEILQKVEK